MSIFLKSSHPSQAAHQCHIFQMIHSRPFLTGATLTVVTESWSKECSKLLPGPSSKFYLFLTVQLCDWLSQLPKLKSLGRPRQNFASLSSSASFRLTYNIYYFEKKNWQKRNQSHCCRDLKSTLKHIAKKIPSQTEVAPRRTQKL